jgi:hypothetical protein
MAKAEPEDALTTTIYARVPKKTKLYVDRYAAEHGMTLAKPPRGFSNGD